MRYFQQLTVSTIARSSLSSDQEKAAFADDTKIVCPSCEATCAPHIKFCLQCGEGLWRPCPECDESIPINSSFCGSCGYDLRKIVKESDEFFAGTLEEAKRHASAFDLTSAIRVILAAADSPKLHRTSQRQQMMDLVKDYRERKNELKADCEQRFEKAKRLFKDGHKTQAYELLSGIPGPVRTADAEELLKEIDFQKAESKRLGNEIEALIKKKDLVSALPKIRSLLVYRPNDAKLTKLAADIVKKILATVEQLKQKYRFDDAYTLIKKVEDTGSSSKSAQLKDEIEQIVWINNYVKKLIPVDKTLIYCLKHLTSLVPTEGNKKLLVEATKRVKAIESGKVPTWTPGPKKPVLGFKVARPEEPQFLKGFSSINVEGIGAGSFRVAAGLAIQGLGLDTIKADLSPKKSSFFGLGGRKTGKVAWGVDFGNSSAKFVKLSAENSNQLQVEKFDRVPYDSVETITSSTDLRAKMVEALVHWKTKHAIRKDEVIVCNINANQALARYIMLPPSDDKALKAALEFEVKLQIPFSLDEMVWGYHNFPTIIKGKKLSFVIAARKKDTGLLSEMFTAHGLKLAGIQSESVALYNFSQLAFKTEDSEECQIALDIGSVSSTLTVMSLGQLWFRTMGTGTFHFAKALSRQLQLNSEQAEERLWNLPSAGADIVKTLKALSSPFQELLAEVDRSIKANTSDLGEIYAPEISVIGGGANLHGLTSYLSHGMEAFTVS